MTRYLTLVLLVAACGTGASSNALAAPQTTPLRVVAKGGNALSLGSDARRYAYYRSTDFAPNEPAHLTVIDTWRSKSRAVPLDPDCGPAADDGRGSAYGRALFSCRDTTAPSRVLNLRTGQISDPNPRFVIEGEERQVRFSLIGRHWLAARTACGRPGGCWALYNFRTGDRRVVPRGRRAPDLDSRAYRRRPACERYEYTERPLLARGRQDMRFDEFPYRLKGSGPNRYIDQLVLARCGRGEIVLDRREMDYDLTLAEGLVTWHIKDAAYAYDINGHRRYRWLVPGVYRMVQTRNRVFLAATGRVLVARVPRAR